MKRTLLTAFFGIILLAGCDFPDGNLTAVGSATITKITKQEDGKALFRIESREGGAGYAVKLILPNDFGRVGDTVAVIRTNGMVAIAVAPIRAED